MDDLIYKRVAIDVLKCKQDNGNGDISRFYNTIIQHDIEAIEQLPSAHPDNQVHLCDSCSYTYPECPSVYTDVIFGNGIGNDNICACSKYLPPAQPEQRWIPVAKKLPKKEEKSYWVCLESGGQCQCRWTNDIYGVGVSELST